jgi:hypothetical protein
MYPAGHSHLHDSADRFRRRLNALLETRESVTLGVARNRLVIDSATTDPKNALLRDLAQRLHRHRLASVHLARGATLEEVEGLLNALSRDPQRGDGPVGKRLDRVGPWSHIRLRQVGFDMLALQNSPSEGSEDSDVVHDGWVELAQLALASEQAAGAPDTDPLVVAEAIQRKSGEVAYDRVVLGYLARVAEESSGRKGAAEEQLMQRVSKLIASLDHATLRRLLETGADQVERRKFALNASQVLAADAVMEVVEAAAEASHQTISHNLLRLLHKLAHHASRGKTEVRAQAEGALRTNVARLIGDWALEDPNPQGYTAILEGMVRRSAAENSLLSLQGGCQPEIIVQMALELGCVGPAVHAAIEAMLARRDLMQIANLLKAAPRTDASEEIWKYVATPARLNAELAASPLDQDAVGILVTRLGKVAADSLLDCLQSASDRSTRAAVLKQLLALGPAIGPVALARMPSAPWFLQRNLLVLFGRMKSWPEGFSPETYARDPDSRIRREAVKLMLESASHQRQGVTLGLGDPDEGIVALTLTAATESCPPQALPLVHQIAMDAKRTSELRVLAIRILARARTPETFRTLLEFAAPRRRWFGKRYPPKSPELLASIAGLTAHWRDEPVAAAIVADALQHPDPDIRSAAASPAS